MYNSYKTIQQILMEVPSLRSYLRDEDTYYAHRDRNGLKAPETLVEHIELVEKYFLQLIRDHHLDEVIDTLISDYLKVVGVDNNSVGEEIKRQFVCVIRFHDHGKVNENFQADSTKMNNANFYGMEIKDSVLSTTHSSLGAFIFLVDQFESILKMVKPKEIYCLVFTAYVFSYSIFKHHSSSINDNVEDTLNMDTLFNNEREKVLEFMSKYLPLFGYKIRKELIAYVGNKNLLRNTFKDFNKSDAMYSLLKLNFSLLTASDYLATNEYCNSYKNVPVKSILDNGVFSFDRINEIYQNVTTKEKLVNNKEKVNFNSKTYSDLEGYILSNPRTLSGDNLNVLRKEMGIEVINNIRKNIDKNLFYIEAPTGGGKTNLSALAAIELLKAHKGKINKVFYVFPFTTLITQTKASLKETLGLTEDEIIELHSKASFTEKSEHDDTYGKDKLNYITNLFVHYPMCLLSHIGFFDIIKSNRKENNYLFHRLANSVVVIDELQSYNPSQWDKVIYFINHFAKAFNIKFILMSATLPKLDKLDFLKEKVNDFVYLVPDAKEKYFRNPNFCERIAFNFEYFEKRVSLSELADRLVEESKQYATFDYGKAKPKDSVYTIIEFIYKQSATDFYDLLKECDFFDEVFVLSGTILEHRRQYIINFLKDNDNRHKKILLITTQVVEAGVDIDMDLGFKDRSLIDSDEQLAGRINRNVNKKNCKLFLFDYNKESAVYGSDLRYKLTKEKITPKLYKEILEKKDFDQLYDLVINNRNQWSAKPMVENVKDYITHLKELRFESVANDFKLIDSNNISCFIPLEIPINIGDTSFFTQKELDFLVLYNIKPTKENKICGVKVFDLYTDIICNRVDFISQKIREKQLQSIMSKYVFSVFATKNIENQLAHYSNPDKSKFGYEYIERWNVFYSEAGGMDTMSLNGIEESQFL
ncbi:CRISPR-associated helicase Cas3' [Myroides odoratimimus]|uniref:CRISPR-associated helicase Cas3' n=1 Tax=Myroides odoratimimus TaxID=76832 RepID=UPI001CE0F32A|nr:CRISPR-associated helicase Cas3' [Myroides odoratimimus]MCA4806499.1 CRISPR-associated helicase Cas3' [Myroides odoratimimus]